MFDRLLGWYTKHFRVLLSPNGILSGAKLTLRPRLAFSYIGNVTARHSSSQITVSQTLRNGTRNGIPELSLLVLLGDRFALCYRIVVCLSVCPVLSVTLVYCGQTVGRIKMKVGMPVGLGPGHIVLDGDPAPPPQRGPSPLPQFSAHICCGQTAG